MEMMEKEKSPGYESAQEWCAVNGWTDLFEEEGKFYAFPPKAVMPLPVPIRQHFEEALPTLQFIISSLFPPKLILSFTLLFAIDTFTFLPILRPYHYRIILLPIGSLKAVSWILFIIKLIPAIWYTVRSWRIYKLFIQGDCDCLSGLHIFAQASANLIFLVCFFRLLQALLFGLESLSN